MCFFDDSATTEIYTLSLHDALPILDALKKAGGNPRYTELAFIGHNSWDAAYASEDRKSTRLNSSHTVISYAVFCLKKKTADRQRQAGRGLRGRSRNRAEYRRQ